MALRYVLFWLALSSVSAVQAEVAFDVIVVGSEPEGVMAAVAAAEESARTLLLSEDARVGGLFVLGEMNSLDLRTEPHVQRGLFERWWERVGRGSAFDVGQAEAAFDAMLREAGVVMQLGTDTPTPVVKAGTVVGVRIGDDILNAKQVVDATADGDLAAAAGAAHTLGFASLGVDERMADTLVFRIEGIDWDALEAGVRERGPEYAHVNRDTAWGSFGGLPAAYEAEGEGLRLRGLNLGRQADGSVLVNALLIYGIDPFDPASVADGMTRARLEAPRIVRYLRVLPGFEDATYGGVAEKLYIRETRHFQTRCTLTVDDALDNIVREGDVVAGNYPLDVQTLTPFDNGYVYGVPELYGARLCVTLPETLDNLWIVGRAAGYDPLAASSARVVPFGMALGEAVGVAAAEAARTGVSTQAFAADRGAVQRLRERLVARGTYLPEVGARTPSGPVAHPYFEAYRTLRRKGLALGGYENDPQLNAEMPALGFLYLLANVGQRFWEDDIGDVLLEAFPNLTGELTPELALDLTHTAGCALGACPDTTASAVSRFNEDGLTRGEAYALAAELVPPKGD
jgi:hypothetical protein